MGAANVALLTVHHCPAVQDIAEEFIITVVNEPLRSPFLELVDRVEKLDTEGVSSLNHFANVLIKIAAESSDSEEFEYIMGTNERVFELWKRTADNPTVPEGDHKTAAHRSAATSIATIKIQKWVEESGTTLPMVTANKLTEQIFNALQDGSYFGENYPAKKVEMSPNGEMRFVGAADEEDFADFFDGNEVIL